VLSIMVYASESTDNSASVMVIVSKDIEKTFVAIKTNPFRILKNTVNSRTTKHPLLHFFMFLSPFTII